MDFRAIRAFFDRFSERFPLVPRHRFSRYGNSWDRPRRPKAARKFVLPVTQSLQKCKVCGGHNTNCAVSSSFWNIFRKVAKNAKFLDSIPKSASKRKVFGIFSENCIETQSFWNLFQKLHRNILSILCVGSFSRPDWSRTA